MIYQVLSWLVFSVLRGFLFHYSSYTIRLDTSSYSFSPLSGIGNSSSKGVLFTGDDAGELVELLAFSWFSVVS